MVRSVKILRIVLPILFVAFLGVLALSFTEASRRQRSVSEPVTSPIRQGENPQLIAYAFEDVQTIGGRVVSRIRARRTMGFASGWYTLEDVHLTIYRENGEAYELVAPQAQFRPETKEAEAVGGVRITASDGVEIETASINFDGSRLVNRIPVRFRVDHWQGRAGAVDLNVASEHLRLFDSIEAERTLPGEPPLTLRASTADFDRVSNDAVFRGEVTIERAGDVLTSETITARVEEKARSLTGLEGCCGVTFHLGAGSPIAGRAQAGATVVRGERFFTDVGPAGQIRAIFIEGGERTASTVMAGPPRRTLRSDQFRVVLDSDGVSELNASGRARLEESGETARSISGARMTAHFDPERHAVTSAVIEGNLEYRDAQNRATAQRGTFDFLSERVVLAAVPGSLPAIESDGQKLTAQSIEIHPRTGVLTATGFVKVRFVNEKGGSSLDSSGLFPESQSPVYVNADRLVLQQKEQSAQFSGNVRAWQDENILLASEMRLDQSGSSLVARKGVRAVLYNAGDENRTSPVQASAETLTARRDAREAVLEGEVRIEDQGRVLEAERATFHFDAAQKLERVEATGQIQVTERASGRTGSGSRLRYLVPKEKIHLEGSPATVTDARGTVKGSEIVFDLTRNHVEILRGEGQTEATYRPDTSAP